MDTLVSNREEEEEEMTRREVDGISQAVGAE